MLTSFRYFKEHVYKIYMRWWCYN